MSDEMPRMFEEQDAGPVEVPLHDPVNDQIAARFRDDLELHVKSMRRTLDQTEGTVPPALATVAVTLEAAGDGPGLYTRMRLCGLLAVALARIVELEDALDAHHR